MVDFGGWEMPLNYGSQIEEHHAVRKDAEHVRCLACVRSMSMACGQKSFLKRLIANDVDKLKEPGKALYSAMLNNSGGVIDDLIVYWRGGDSHRVVINTATATKDLAHMNRIAEAYDADITPKKMWR